MHIMDQDLQKICTRLYHTNRDDLYAYLIRSMREESTALDLMQDVFLNFFKIFQTKELPPNDTECRMYLFKIARNLMINYSRSAYQRKVDLVENYEVTESKQTKSSITPENQVIHEMEVHDAEQLLQELLGNLDEKLRTLLHLRYHANMNLEEIAEITDSVVSTVSRQIKKAERILRDESKARGYMISL